VPDTFSLQKMLRTAGVLPFPLHKGKGEGGHRSEERKGSLLSFQ